MADKAEGTHIIEPDTGTVGKTELVKRVVNNHEVEVSPELATYLDEQKTYYADLQTKHQSAMEEAKAIGTSYADRLAKDTAWYSSNPQEAWGSYIPLVTDANGGYKGDPALLIPKTQADDAYNEHEPKVKAMTPDPIQSELAQLRKEQEEIKLQIARDKGQNTLSIMDSILTDPKLNFAKRAEVLAEVKDYYTRTGGQQPTKQVIKGFVQASHDSTKELVNKAGSFTEKPRYSGASPSGGMPREKVTGITGNIFGTQTERDEANRALADKLDGKIL